MPDFRGGLFYEKCWNTKNFVASLASMTQPPCPKAQGGDRFGKNTLFGVRACPEGRGVQITRPKITCKSKVDPEILISIWPWCQKLFPMELVIDRQTDTHWTPKGFFSFIILCMGYGKLWTCKISNISLREGNFFFTFCMIIQRPGKLNKQRDAPCTRAKCCWMKIVVFSLLILVSPKLT